MVRLHTANGYGSTNTAIRRFTTTVQNTGADITYADSATLGATFTINTDGVYAVSYTDNFNGGASMGLSLNSTQLTTAISSDLMAAADILAMAVTGAVNHLGSVSAQLYLSAGDIIRAHTAGSVTGLNNSVFSIARVS